MPDATTKLLPCPFYGSLDFGYSAQDGHDFVVCNNCGAEGPFSCKTGIAAWNQRTIPWQPIETAPGTSAQFPGSRLKRRLGMGPKFLLGTEVKCKSTGQDLQDLLRTGIRMRN